MSISLSRISSDAIFEIFEIGLSFSFWSRASLLSHFFTSLQPAVLRMGILHLNGIDPLPVSSWILLSILTYC